MTDEEILSKAYAEMWPDESLKEETIDKDSLFDWKENSRGEEVRGKFIPKRLADEIMRRLPIKTMGAHGTIFYYNDGVYHDNGEERIGNFVSTVLGEDSTAHRISEVLTHIKTQTYSTRENGIKPEIVNVRNGLLNIMTGKLSRHTPKYFITAQIPVRFNPEADCPRIKEFLSEILAESDIPVVQEIFGYTLWGDYRLQKAIMFIGEGANGKSTLLALMRAFLGAANVASISLQDLIENDFARSRLYGKMANLFADLPNAALKQTGNFKIMTGGDAMFANVKFHEGFDFVNRAKLIFSCNKLPNRYDESDAFVRRWIFLTFPNIFEGSNCKPDILKDLITPEELSGLLNWALEGCRRVISSGKFTNSKQTEELREYYDRMSRPVSAFARDAVDVDPKGFVVKRDLFSHFCTYCSENKLPPTSEQMFFRQVYHIFGHKIREEQKNIEGKKGVRCFAGIILATHETHQTHQNSLLKVELRGDDIISINKGNGVYPVLDVSKVLSFIPIDGISYADLRKVVPELDEAGFERFMDQLRAEGRIYEDTPGHIKKV